jgi:hypothetical protein
VYNLLTKDVLGLKVKRMYNAIPSTIKPYTHPVTQQVEYIERTIGTATERYNLKGKQIQGDTGAHLVYMWWTDHTSEILPSENTIARAIQNSAEEVLYTDNWIKHYFKRGGIRPTLVAMKGLIDPTAKEQKEESWSKWLMQLGRDTWRKVRMYNAEAIDIKPFGDGIGDLKDNKVYEQALANIAMGTGIPLSLLLANSANYATASVEERQWYKSKIAPLCRWLAYNYNEQIFHPMFNQHLIFKTESVDAQQEEESARMDSATKFLDLLMKCPSYEMLEGIANTLGMEISEDLLKAAEKFFTDKEQREKEMQAQMQQGGYVVGADGKPVPVQTKPGEDPKEEPEDDEPEEEEKKPFPPAKKTWTPSLDEIKEISTWHDIALRHLKKAGNLAEFDYLPHHGGVPAEYGDAVKAKLQAATTPEDVRAAFDVAADVTPVPAYKADEVNPATLALAESINKLAEVYKESGK